MHRRSTKLLIAALVAASAAAVVSAQTHINAKLGLWEMTITNKIGGMPDMPAMPQVDLSQVPPEQRARVEAMMKQRQGMMGGQPTVTKQCITKEKLEKPFYQDAKMDPSCKQTPITTTATVQEFKVECTGAQKMNGTVHFEAADPEHVNGTMHFNAEGPQGKAMTIDGTVAGKWIASDCGDVK